MHPSTPAPPLLSSSAQKEDEFVDAFMSRIIALIPGRERIRDSFAYEEELSYVPLPSLLPFHPVLGAVILCAIRSIGGIFSSSMLRRETPGLLVSRG